MQPWWQVEVLLWTGWIETSVEVLTKKCTLKNLTVYIMAKCTMWLTTLSEVLFESVFGSALFGPDHKLNVKMVNLHFFSFNVGVIRWFCPRTSNELPRGAPEIQTTNDANLRFSLPASGCVWSWHHQTLSQGIVLDTTYPHSSVIIIYTQESHYQI